jgi:cytochrome c-type biogenesis protein CcmH/NrfF
MTRWLLWVVPICLVVVMATAYWGRGYIHKQALATTSVTVERLPSTPNSNDQLQRVQQIARQLRAMSQSASEPAATQPPINPPLVAQEPRSLTCGKYLDQLARRAELTSSERESVSRVFKIAAQMQKGIDAEASPENRAAYQQQLIASIELRLRLILKDERRAEIARDGLRDVPRIMPDT